MNILRLWIYTGPNKFPERPNGQNMKLPYLTPQCIPTSISISTLKIPYLAASTHCLFAFYLATI